MVRKRPLMIGLTGGIGSGKSLALRILSRRGIPCLQTDRVGHRLLLDRGVLRSIRRLFGEGVMGRGGRIDREKLARAAFGSRELGRKLGRLLHPLIRRSVSEWAEGLGKRSRRPPFAVVEVPLLFEGGYNRWFDGCLSLSSPRRSRHRRLLARGWTRAQIRAREAAQWSPSRKDRRADWVLLNRGSKGELEAALLDWKGRIQAAPGGAGTGSRKRDRKEHP